MDERVLWVGHCCTDLFLITNVYHKGKLYVMPEKYKSSKIFWAGIFSLSSSIRHDNRVTSDKSRFIEFKSLCRNQFQFRLNFAVRNYLNSNQAQDGKNRCY